MQFTFDFDDRPEKLIEIHRRLKQHFGSSQPDSPFDPVSQLVMAIISGQTKAEVYRSVFSKLQRRFGNWDNLRDAQVTEIENAISRVTHAKDKAQRLKDALKDITKVRGQLGLDWLDDLTVDEAIAWLERLPGVGRKASAATLNFSTLQKSALVIDTHHLWILTRLNFVHEKSSIEKAYDEIMPLLPSDWSPVDFDEHHQLFQILGQTTCEKSNQACFRCPINDLCPSNTSHLG